MASSYGMAIDLAAEEPGVTSEAQEFCPA